ncbi:MAG: class I SAM-dependent methyltransferase [Candidatus Azotimanducaceae bacterium]
MSDENNTQIEFWNGEAGLKWVSDQEKMDLMLNPLSDIAIDLAQPKLDESVIDIGCGCGATSIELARRGAKVWGMDVSAPMLTRARERAASYPESLFTEADASSFEFSSDQQLLFSRFGVMFFADPVKAFTNLRSALTDDGRMVFLCWQAANKNEWISRVGQAVKRFLPEPSETPDPKAPGPFAFADNDYLASILTQSGFQGIEIQPVSLDLRLASSVEEAVDFQSNIGPLSAVLSAVRGASARGCADRSASSFAGVAKRRGYKTWLCSMASFCG